MSLKRWKSNGRRGWGPRFEKRHLDRAPCTKFTNEAGKARVPPDKMKKVTWIGDSRRKRGHTVSSKLVNMGVPGQDG